MEDNRTIQDLVGSPGTSFAEYAGFSREERRRWHLRQAGTGREHPLPESGPDGEPDSPPDAPAARRPMRRSRSASHPNASDLPAQQSA